MLWALVMVAATPTGVEVAADGTVALPGHRLELKLTALCRGACVELARPRVERPAPGTTTLYYPGGVTQTFSPAAQGIEQTFVVQGGPMCHGDVTLELEAKGLPYLGADARGHLFGVRGSRGARYSEAFVVRPRGERVRVAVERTARGLKIVVPARLADAPGAWPMVVDPLITGVELPLDLPQLPYAAEASRQLTPRVAAAGGNFFAAWRDDREGDLAIYGTRLLPTAAAIWPYAPVLGVRLVPGVGASLALAGFSGPAGARYWLAWEEQQPPTATLLPPLSAMVLDVVGTPGPSFDLGRGTSPQLSCTGGECLAVWDVADPTTGPPTIVGRRLPSATASGSAPSPLMLMVDGGHSPALAPTADDRGWVMVWVEDIGSAGQVARAAIFALDGGRLPSDGSGYVLGSSPATLKMLTPTVASSPNANVAAWHAYDPVGLDSIMGAAFTSDGVLVNPARPIVPYEEVANPVLSREGGHWLLVWQSAAGNNGFVLKYSRLDGSLISNAGLRVTNRSVAEAQERLPSIAYDRVPPLNEDHSYLVYELGQPPLPDVEVVHWLAADGGYTPMVELPLAVASNKQHSISAAALSDGFFAAWVDSRTPDRRVVFGATYLADGGRPDLPFPLTPAGQAQPEPAVAAIGDTALVAVLEPLQGAVKAVLVPRGAPLGAPIALAGPVPLTELSSVAVAAGAGEFLVAWTQYGGGLFVRRVNPVTGMGPDLGPIMIVQGSAARPTVTFDGKHFILVWEAGLSNPHLQSAAFDPATSAVIPGAMSISGLEQRYPQLASNRQNSSLLVYCERNVAAGNTTQWDVKALVVDTNADPVATTGFPLVDALTTRAEPPIRPVAVQGDGVNYVVAVDRGGIVLGEVDPAAKVVTPLGPSSIAGHRPALAIAPGGDGLMFYDRFSATDGTFRGYFLALRNGPDGGLPPSADGGVDGGQTVQPPHLTLARIDVACAGQVDQRLGAEGAGPITWSIDAPPKGLTLDPQGRLTWAPPFAAGVAEYHFTVHATNGGGASTADLALQVSCPDRLDFSTRACGCGAADGLGAVLAALALMALGRKRS